MVKTKILFFIYIKLQKHASNNDAIYKWLINKECDAFGMQIFTKNDDCF